MGSAKSKGVQNQPTPKVPIFRKNIPVETKSVYWMRYKYAGYKIAGSLEIEGDTLKGEIKYMEKTEDAKGLGDFLQTLETDAIANGCKYIEIEHDQLRFTGQQTKPTQAFTLRLCEGQTAHRALRLQRFLTGLEQGVFTVQLRITDFFDILAEAFEPLFHHP